MSSYYMFAFYRRRITQILYSRKEEFLSKTRESSVAQPDKDERDFSVSGIHGKDNHQNLSSTRTCPVWSNSLRNIT